MIDNNLKKILKKVKEDNTISEDDLQAFVADYDIPNEEVIGFLNSKEIKVIPSANENMEDGEPDDGDLSSLEYENLNIIDFKIDQVEQQQNSNDPVRLYLKEIGEIPLLKLDEEKKYGKAVYEMRVAQQYLNDCTEKGIILDKKEQKNTEKVIQKGRFASDKLTEANYRLVVATAKKYEKSGMNFLDLIQDGNMGLMRAVEKFDYTKGFKFSTYATWWIKQAITRSIAEKSRTIRIPVHMNETINKMNRAKRELTQILSREPSDKEIADRLGENVEKIQHIKNISRDPMSLETPVGEEEDSSLGDFISDPSSITPHEFMERENLESLLDEALESLTDREEKVLRMRSGLYDGHEYTLEEVGKEFGVTRERIRQIENKAKQKLKTPALKEKFKHYYIKK